MVPVILKLSVLGVAVQSLLLRLPMPKQGEKPNEQQLIEGSEYFSQYRTVNYCTTRANAFIYLLLVTSYQYFKISLIIVNK